MHSGSLNQPEFFHMFTKKTFRFQLYLMKQIDWKLVCVAIMIEFLNDAFSFTKKIITKPSHLNFLSEKSIVQMMVH